MAFNVQNWARNTVDANEPYGALQSPTPGGYTGCYREWLYTSPTDTQATVSASGYFNSIGFGLATGDLIKVYSVTEGTYVTYIVTSTQGIDPTAAPVITVAQVGSYGVSSRFTFTAANIIAGYATPLALLAAPGANLMYTNVSAEFVWTYGSAQFTTGGNLGVQYGNTANLGGTKCTSTFTNTQVNGIAANSISSLIPVTVAPTATASIANTGLFLSNDTAAFAVGTGTTVLVTVQALVVPTV